MLGSGKNYKENEVKKKIKIKIGLEISGCYIGGGC